MALQKGEKINKWIDLSTLPTCKNGHIDWKQSVGKEVKFTYGDITGVLKILQCERYTNKAVIFIDGYTSKYGKSICVDQIKTCSLGNILRKPIAETHPEMIIYFINTEDAYTYSAHSSKEVFTICPKCGTIKKQPILRLTNKGFACPVCSDGISYPNKFMYDILKQLNIDFIREVSKKHIGFQWVKNYKYDFCIEIDDQKYFIEMDGKFHFIDAFSSYEQTQLTDQTKDDLANAHSVEVIRINCNYKEIKDRFDFIKKQIENSKLHILFDLSSINWQQANKNALKSYVFETAQMWNNGIYNKKQIAKLLGVSVDVVSNYLKLAGEIGLCTYNQEHAKDLFKQTVAKRFSKPIMLFKDNVIINVFPSAIELDRCSMTMYGKHLMSQHISEVCRGERKQTGGFTMKYITYQEYEQLAPQFKQTIQN